MCRSQVCLPLITLIIVAYIQITYQESLVNQTSSGLRKGRWGMFFTFEPICTIACRKNGKFSGRMYGGVCRCYCPRTEKAPCSGTYPSCDRLCRQNAYEHGGDCVDETNCYCFCTVRQRQAPNGTDPTTTGSPCPSTTVTAPPGIGSPNAPSPGSIGQTKTKKRHRPRTRKPQQHKVSLIHLVS